MRTRIQRLSLSLFLLYGAGSACQCDDELSVLNAALVVTPASLDFGEVPVGAEKKLPINLRNRGEFKLTLLSFSAAAPFVAPTIPTSTIATLFTGRDRDFEVGFRSPSVGNFSGMLAITSDDPKVPTITVPLTGIGIEAAVLVEPLVVDFGEVLWNQATTPMSRTVTVTNPGTDSFMLTSNTLVESGAAAFALDALGSVGTYGPNASQTFTVSFVPKAMGPVMGRVSLKTTAPMAAEIFVTLMARAVGPVMEVCAGPTGGPELCTTAMQTPRIDFLIPLSMRGTGRIRVLNTGDRNLTGGAQLLGMADEFMLAPNPMTLGMFTLTPGTEQPFDVTYLPDDYVFDSVNLAIGSDSAVRMSTVVRLDGRSPRPVLNAVPRTANMTIAGTAMHSEVYVTLTNCGELPVVLSGVPVVANQTGPSNAFTLTNAPAGGTTINPGPCQQGDPGVDFRVNFDPTSVGLYTGRVQIMSNNPANPTFEIVLNGDKRP